MTPPIDGDPGDTGTTQEDCEDQDSGAVANPPPQEIRDVWEGDLESPLEFVSAEQIYPADETRPESQLSDSDEGYSGENSPADNPDETAPASAWIQPPAAGEPEEDEVFYGPKPKPVRPRQGNGQRPKLREDRQRRGSFTDMLRWFTGQD